MARAEVTEDRIGEMRIEDLRAPFLSFFEQAGQIMDEVERRVGFEQCNSRGGRAAASVQRHDEHLSPLKRCEEREEEGEHDRDRREARCACGDGEEPCQAGGRYDVKTDVPA